MAKKIDKDSGLLYEVKRPAENKTYSIDFKNIIPSGETITSVDSVVATAVGLVAETSALAVGTTGSSSTTVNVKLSAGTDGENYEVAITVTDANGDVHADDVMIKVRKAGNV
jgi:hypothetical protein